MVSAALDDDWAPRRGRVRLVPVLHGSLEIAALARSVLLASRPAAVAVELPPSFGTAVQRAVRRLPKVSAVFDVVPGAGAARLYVCSPGEPFAEALRTAAELGIEASLIDADVDPEEPVRDVVPDSHALWNLGPKSYFELLYEALDSGQPASLRERIMAHRLQDLASGLSRDGDVLAFVGAAHVRALADLLGSPQPRPLARELQRQVEVRHVESQSVPALVDGAPILDAAWEEIRHGRRPEAPPPQAVRSAKLSLDLQPEGFRLLQGDGDTATADADRADQVRRFVAAHAARELEGEFLALDRVRAGEALWKTAELSYLEQTTVRPARWQRRVFFDFARRYARVQGRLAPDLYEWVVAARGVGDDVLAWEMYEACCGLPWQSGPQDLDTVSVDGDELDLGTRRLRFRPWSLKVKRPGLRLKPRPKPDDPDEWLEGFRGGLCSYPPEDLLIEDFGTALADRARALLQQQRSRVERFRGGMLDGIDLRETVRRRANEQETVPGPAIWVREEGRSPGASGAVVVIFDDDESDEKYPYRMTWLSEHEDESDMAFFATTPLDQIVGPGITRATYGGLMMTRPPGRLADVWADPDYASLGLKSRQLLVAAIDYSIEPLVTYVGPQAPVSWIHAYARRQGKQVVHLPLGSLSPRSLAQLRVVHLLAGRDKRDIAPRYIW